MSENLFTTACGWRLFAASDLRWLSLDGDWLVHEVGSGLIVRVSALEASLLQLLSSGDILTLPQFRAGLQDLLLGEVLVCEDEQLSNSLSRLVWLGLVRIDAHSPE